MKNKKSYIQPSAPNFLLGNEALLKTMRQFVTRIGAGTISPLSYTTQALLLLYAVWMVGKEGNIPIEIFRL